MKIRINTKAEKVALDESAKRLASFLNQEIEMTRGKFDYGLLVLTLVGSAVQVLQARGFNREDIEEAVLKSAEEQFGKASTIQILKH